MRVGIVIATRGRRAELLRTLGRLQALPERVPIVVVDNGSRDGTPAAVRARHPAVTVIELDANAGGAARTVGARALDTELVAFSDDDSWWAPGALARATEHFERHGSLGLLAARILVGPEERLDPTCAAMSASPLEPDPSLPGPPVLGFVACGAIVRRDAFLSVGGFDHRLGVGGEERLLALDLAAAGWGLAYVDDVLAYHHPSVAGRRRGRVAAQLRNDLWVSWLRLPPLAAARQTIRLIARSVRQRHPAMLVQAARGLPWIVRERRVLPSVVERAARRLE